MGTLFLVFTTRAAGPFGLPVARRIAPSTLPGTSFSEAYRHTTERNKVRVVRKEGKEGKKDRQIDVVLNFSRDFSFFCSHLAKH